jgi:hypothetical protein
MNHQQQILPDRREPACKTNSISIQRSLIDARHMGVHSIEGLLCQHTSS